MKQKITLALMIFVSCFFSSQAQTQFWSDTFEDTGAPTSGTRTPETNGGVGSPFTAYFVRTNNAGINSVFSLSGGYLGLQGSKFWAGEDHDGAAGAGNEEQQIDFTGINISGKSGLAFKGFFAANNITAAFENMALGGSHSDYIIVEYRFDSVGAYTSLLSFYANNAVTSGANNKSLALDTDNNNIGDGTILGQTFAEIGKVIVGTGTTIDIRIRSYMNGGSEEWAIDNFILTETPACVSPIAYTVTGGGSYCAGGSGVTIGLSNSETGVTYQLKNGSSDAGSPVTGTGTAISFGNQTVATTYTVIATRTVGACTTTMSGSAIVTITPLPATPTITSSSSTTFCSGGSVTLTSSSTSGNMWSTGATTASISVSTGGTYTVAVTSGGCTSATSAGTTVTVNPLPNSSVSQSAGILTANQNSAAYQWYQCPNTLLTGQTNQTFTPSVVGDYKVNITFSGCSVTSTCVTVTTLGNADFELYSKFRIYPVPNNGILNIDSEVAGDLQIINQIGQIVKTFKINPNVTNSINVEELSNGTYFIKGINELKIKTQRLIIKK